MSCAGPIVGDGGEIERRSTSVVVVLGVIWGIFNFLSVQVRDVVVQSLFSSVSRVPVGQILEDREILFSDSRHDKDN